jgi:molecular chaperone DnaJ
MNTQEACNILGINIGSSEEDVSKSFRNKAAKYHPDQNKDPDAENKFKEISSAYEYLKANGTTQKVQFPNIGMNINDILNQQINDLFNGGSFRRVSVVDFNNIINIQPIYLKMQISFVESVLGATKVIKYTHKVACDECNASNDQNKSICQKCDGKGKRKYNSKDTIELPCTTCKGLGHISLNKCLKCNGEMFILKDDEQKFRIFPGVDGSMQIRIQGAGNWENGKYGDLCISISIIPDSDMKRDGDDVISVIELSLLEALQGTKKKVKTVRGLKYLNIEPKIKNRDAIQISGFGVPPAGKHVFIVNVTYPEDVSELIGVLSKHQDEVTEEINGSKI